MFHSFVLCSAGVPACQAMSSLNVCLLTQSRCHGSKGVESVYRRRPSSLVARRARLSAGGPPAGPDNATGFWTGAACDDCLDGYWGANCTGACVVLNGVQCGGHGTCDEGVLGTGGRLP